MEKSKRPKKQDEFFRDTALLFTVVLILVVMALILPFLGRCGLICGIISISLLYSSVFFGWGIGKFLADKFINFLGLGDITRRKK